jgi:type IV secretion system pilin
MTYTKKVLFCFIVIFLITIPIFQLSAQTEALKSAKQGLVDSAYKAELTDQEGTLAADPYILISNVVGYVLSFIGVILLVNMIFAGYSWMNSGGNEEKIKKAKEKIVSSIIGLIIIVAAYILTDLIFGSLDSLITGSQ